MGAKVLWELRFAVTLSDPIAALSVTRLYQPKTVILLEARVFS
jgi:hypothetical protein